MMNTAKLTNIQKDVLKEIGNIGAGNATTAMAKMVDKPLLMEVPSVEVVTINEMVESIGDPEAYVVSILFKVKGKAPGTVYFILPVEEAEVLVQDILMNDQTSLIKGDEPDALAISVMQETANILIGAYVSALSDLTNIKMTTTIPYFSMDMAAASLVAGLVEVSQVTDQAILIDTRINDNKDANGVQGQVLLIPDPESIKNILKALGIEVDE